MTLSELNFIKLLPIFMRSDNANKVLSEFTDEQVKAIAETINIMVIWDWLSELPDVYLDLLAWQLDITWYNSAADRKTRVKIIRESDRMHMILGGRAAVEQILSTCFGKVEMREWFEYNGTHDHFSLLIPEVKTVAEPEEFMRVLNAIKRASSVFDGWLVGFDPDSNIYSGAAVHEYSNESYSLFRDTYDDGFISIENEQYYTSDNLLFEVYEAVFYLTSDGNRIQTSDNSLLLVKY